MINPKRRITGISWDRTCWIVIRNQLGTKLVQLIKEQATNAYTIEKNGVKKLIYQTPWYENGEFMGLVEFSLEIPFEMPHYVRKPKTE